jgi:hypothetical protein
MTAPARKHAATTTLLTEAGIDPAAYQARQAALASTPTDPATTQTLAPSRPHSAPRWTALTPSPMHTAFGATTSGPGECANSTSIPASTRLRGANVPSCSSCSMTAWRRRAASSSPDLAAPDSPLLPRLIVPSAPFVLITHELAAIDRRRLRGPALDNLEDARSAIMRALDVVFSAAG